MFIQSTAVPSRESAFGDPPSADLGPTLSATRVHQLSRSNTLHHPQLHSVLQSTASPTDTFHQHILIESLLVTYLLPAPQNTYPPGYQPLLRSQIIPPSLGSQLPAPLLYVCKLQAFANPPTSSVQSAVTTAFFSPVSCGPFWHLLKLHPFCCVLLSAAALELENGHSSAEFTVVPEKLC